MARLKLIENSLLTEPSDDACLFHSGDCIIKNQFAFFGRLTDYDCKLPFVFSGPSFYT
jgi:hypothetical protein